MALSRLVRELGARQVEARAHWNPAELLSPWQLKLMCDPAELRVADAGRRSGKTREFVVEGINLCLHKPKARVVFFAKTETDARDLMWQDLWAFIEAYQLGAVTSGRSKVLFPNGSTFAITGAKDPQEAHRRFRGRGFDLVLGDECQLLPWLQDMVQKAIRPALLRDGRRGRLLLGGTPSEVPGVGYWEEICEGQHGEWSVHTATIYDNPVFAGIVEETLATIAKEFGGPQSPIFRREFLRERVPPDESTGLVYRYNKALNHFEQAPKGGRWWYAMGVDLGHTRDTSAIVVLGVTDAAPGKAWLVDEWKAPRRLPLPELAHEIRQRQALYPPQDTIIDEGGLGTAIADELRRDRSDGGHGIPCNAADKTHPLVMPDAINAALTTGKLMLPASSRLAYDLTILRWDLEKLAKGQRKMARQPHSDLEPCLRYQWPTVAGALDQVKAPRVTPKTEDEKELAEVRKLRKQRADRSGWRGLVR